MVQEAEIVEEKPKKRKRIQTVKMVLHKGEAEVSIPYKTMDDLDADLISSELKGISTALANKYVYQIKDKKTGAVQATSLSWAGIKELIRFQNTKRVARIGIVQEVVPKPELLPDGTWMAMAFAKDELSGQGSWGCGVQPAKMSYWDKQSKTRKFMDDPFAPIKAVTKAQRNALRPLIPEMMVAETIERYLTKEPDKVHTVELEEAAPEKTEVETAPSTPDEVAEMISQAIEQTNDPKGLAQIMSRTVGNKYLSEQQRRDLTNKINDKLTALHNKGNANEDQGTSAEGASVVQPDQAVPGEPERLL